MLREQRLPFALIVLGAFSLIASFILDGAGWLLVVPLVLCGVPIVYGAVKGLVTEHDITADVLVSVAIVASVIIGEYEAAAEISIIMQIGAFLEEATVGRADSSIRSLIDRRPMTARVITESGENVVGISEVAVGNIVCVMPGESFPVDGTVVSGSTSVDASMLTGEPMPVDVSEGGTVSSGTVNMFGSVDVRVDRTGDDSTISRMSRLIEDADAGRSRVVRTADRWARYIVATAFAVSIATYLVTHDVYRSVTVLVVFCPCALILATPTAIMAAAGNLARRGVLVKDGAAMENIASVRTLVMDKTGTLTTGDVAYHGTVSAGRIGPEELHALAASLESRSEHPLGKAIVQGYRGTMLEVRSFEYLAGRGVTGMVDGRTVVAGNRGLMETMCPDGLEEVIAMAEEDASKGLMVVYIGVDGTSEGYSVLSDTIRPGAGSVIADARSLGLRTLLLTGDAERVAETTKDALGIDDVVWGCLPEDKLDTVSALESEGAVCMVGDGVNDAASLKRATVGIAMGGVGSDMAMEAADIVVVDDDVSKVPATIRMGRRTLATIKVGISFSLVLNTVAMGLAVLGLMGPVAGALVHNIGSVIVIIGAAMLLRYDCWTGGMSFNTSIDE